MYLLERYHATTELLGRHFGLVNRHSGRGDTNTKTGDDTADHQHADILGGALESMARALKHPINRKRRTTYIEPMIQITAPI
jgi:hypothetical protein